ncbi:MAG: DUF2163 domain-containing protein [Pseudomonadota bacterium]
MSGSNTLQAKLRSGIAHIARCWEVTRSDGVRFGFTDHDEPLSFDGLTFEAGAGLDAGTVERSTGLSVDNAVALGALSSDRVTEADILAGRFDNAVVRQWLVDWTDVSARRVVFEGSVGELRAGGTAFEAELRGKAEALNQPVGRLFLQSCDADLGDRACGVDLTDPSLSAESGVEAHEAQLRLRWIPSGDYDTGWFAGGAITWLSGANVGLRARVRADQTIEGARWLTLWSEARAPIALGDTFRITAGCDKSLRTCRAKFGNLLNFRGFPHMPGDDWVTAYPRTGEVHDGRSAHWNED